MSQLDVLCLEAHRSVSAASGQTISNAVRAGYNQRPNGGSLNSRNCARATVTGGYPLPLAELRNKIANDFRNYTTQPALGLMGQATSE